MKRADHHLIQQLLDGDVTREEFDIIQQRMRDEPGLAALYEDYALLQHSLIEEFDGGDAIKAAPLETTWAKLGASLWLIIVTFLVLVAALLWFRPWEGSGRGEGAAVVAFSVDAVWKIEGPSKVLGGATEVVRGDVLHLFEGRAGISLAPSVSAVIEGPAELTFLSKDSLQVTRGRGFFHRGGTGGGLTVTTPRFMATASGAEFGLEVSPDGPDELLVSSGSVHVESKISGNSMVLAAGDAASVSAAGAISGFPVDGRPFAKSLGRFRSLVSGSFEKSRWRIDYGNPEITPTRIDGRNFSAFLSMPVAEPELGVRVLLITMDLGKPSEGEFHTDGWAGLSLFNGAQEVLFFGDSFGTKATWSLDVKQHIPVIFPERPVSGQRMVTLRYEPRSGQVSLHEGGFPLEPPFCSGKIVPGTTFDEIRIGASSGAALAVKSLAIRVGED